MTCVVQLSGGIPSWFAARICVERYGRDDVTLLFADTLIEDEDLYRFLDDVENDLGMPVTRIAEGRDPWQVFFDRRYLGNTRADPCSLVLKRDFLKAWCKENADPRTDVLAIGIDWTEIERCERITYGNKPFEVIYPLIEENVDKSDALAAATALGIKHPRLYDMGFPHNNCGGFCVKAGLSQFIQLYRQLPERFAYNERREQEFRAFIGKDVAILRDRRCGTTTPMPLAVLRRRIEANDPTLPADDWGGCGCTDDQLSFFTETLVSINNLAATAA